MPSVHWVSPPFHENLCFAGKKLKPTNKRTSSNYLYQHSKGLNGRPGQKNQCFERIWNSFRLWTQHRTPTVLSYVPIASAFQKLQKQIEQQSRGWKHQAQRLPALLLPQPVQKHTVYNLGFHFSSSGWPQNSAWEGPQLPYPMTLHVTSLRNEAGFSKEDI